MANHREPEANGNKNLQANLVDHARLREALKNNEVWPAFQPLVDMHNGAIVGFEVLARWTDPELGIIGPNEFIPLAEATGLIGLLTREVISQACSAAESWPGVFMLSINISPIEFRDPGLLEDIRDTIHSTGFPISRVQIEITEGALLEDVEMVRATIQSFKALGMGLALDDFGTGFASLTQLHAFPFDKLKIDMSFVRTMEGDSCSRKIVTSVIGLGQSLGMAVVAEGVETEQQATMLRRLGCDVGQGWLFGKPLKAADTQRLLSVREHRPLVLRSRNTSPFQRLHQLDALYKAAPIGLCFLDNDLNHVSVNNRFAEMLGTSPCDMIGRSVRDFIPDNEARRVTEDLKRVLAGETVVVEEYQPVGGKGAFLVINQRVDDDAGDPIGISVTAIDVSERRSIEVALRESEDHARWSIELSPNIVWSTDAEGTVNYMGPTLDGTLKGTAERIADWYDRMHPDDRPRVRKQWLAWLPSGEPFETTFRMRFQDSSWRWMISRAKPHRNPQGEIIKWYGVITEIITGKGDPIGDGEHGEEHSRHRAGSSYKGEKERLDATRPRAAADTEHQTLPDALANMADGIAIFDKSGYLSFINPQYSQLFPATRDVRKPGVHFLDILQASIDRGEEPPPTGDLYDWKHQVFANLQKPGARTMAFADGRVIEARWGVSKRGSIIVNYSDLTTAKQTERLLTELNRKLERLAATDGLTGLANRRAFDETIRKACSDAASSNSPLSLLMIDVDSFKPYNDTYGHQGGDDCLKTIASHIALLTVPEDALVARYGGEEIAIVLPRANRHIGSMFANSVCSSVRALSIPHAASRTGVVTVSIGVGTATGSAAEDPARLIAAADKALYEAKAAGRDGVRTNVVTSVEDVGSLDQRAKI
ncbi:EAL domain-containing protein [Rhizobium leguminosarum]|uniref:EAL domain-containing protein n=1 Tax=Rhizobium ruizarguesonis TaxID=2081791 RepID=UPI00103F278D|nr:EAL domain-containing protein [Rhizobium ruizarguesonis]NEI05349.1 EAL domain-containing protein [Rhizobium ruizarguesonis]TCA15619.1 EAL domain-containing protein [Rhizobium leguminosarum bv. viciae]